ncbi:threonine-phosphate decarboxylase CobD [Paraburkholderia sacchari]|uniref:threonine-phosphate decarboxylase CobD n=1 Tax=Paraburkholderia sacchari TaxID=159450 RepID=UPI001BCBDFFA|nr:threonine-phosphate decarboxylase CobD [Paraburkholderia sacchari]
MLNLDHATQVPHGGNLGEAARRYGIARENWLDLSTGINPVGYPVPPVDPQAWLRLPDDDDDLEVIAAAHYGAPEALAVAGTQAAIRMLPAVLPKGRIGIGLLTYGEYAPACERAGFPVDRFVTRDIADLGGAASFVLEPGRPLPADLKHLVLVNPNNPGAERFTPEVIMGWHEELAMRDGTLVVDEAFVEAMPELSVAKFADRGGLIVLRSIGKFFGLAGARAGFVLAGKDVIRAMRSLRGPWSVTGPARIVTRAALLDTDWQTQTRASLAAAGERLADLLGEFFPVVQHTPLFAWVRDERAPQWQDGLARHAVWTRRFDVVRGLRFGLPADASGWARLDAALRAVSREVNAGGV